MKKLLVFACAVLVLNSNLFAQYEEIESPAPVEKSDFKKNFYLALSTSTYMDMLVTPLRYYYTATGNTDALGNPTYANIPFQSMQYNIVTLGLEPRYNLKDFNEDMALAITAPVSFGIGVTGPVDDTKVKGTNGFGSIQVPIMMRIYTGNGSTYSTMKNFGFNFGGGIEFNKIGLINFTGESNQFNKAFVLPVLTAGVTFMRGDSPMEVNFKYGFGPMKNQDVNNQGDPLTDNTGIPYRRTTRGQTLKLSFIYLMNY
jgi:hypothetical protein